MENVFSENITNEELAQLPLVHYPGEVIVVDDAVGIAEACAYLSGHEAIGFDTETRPTFRPGPLNKVALLQLSTPEKCFLFRLNKIALDKAIIKILESKKIAKVGADVPGDLRALQGLRRFRPGNFVDLQSLVPDWGITEKSVRKMAGIILGCRISKAQRLSNWEASSLTPAQQLYAATDAGVCLEMYHALLKTEKTSNDPENNT